MKWETKLQRHKVFRGCSYERELARLDGLPHLGEISICFRNSYKSIMCSYEKWASPPRWNLTWFCRDPTLVRWKFSIWTRAYGPARQDGTAFSLISFVLLFRCWSPRRASPLNRASSPSYQPPLRKKSTAYRCCPINFASL